MPHEPTAPLRAVRAILGTGIVLGLAASAHLAGGGRLPHPLILAAMAALTLLAGTILTRRRIRPATMLALLGTSQLILHESFSALSSSAPATPAQAAHMHDAGGLAQAAHSPMPGASMPSESMAGMHHTPGMLAAHVIATLATAALLSYGEATLFAVAQWLRPLWHVFRPRFQHKLRVRDSSSTASHPSQKNIFLTAQPRRGPPVSPAFD